MNSKIFHFLWIFILITIPLNIVKAENFLDVLLRFTGITITTSQVRGNFSGGNLWLVNIDQASSTEPKQITSEGTYHSPLWFPGKNNILVMNKNKLIQIDVYQNQKKTLHTLSDFTILLGFDKNNPDSILILQNNNPGILSLVSGEIDFLAFDKNDPNNRHALDSLMSNFRDYGETQLFIEKQGTLSARNLSKKVNNINKTNKIHINTGCDDIVIPCPGKCAQPALISDKRQLVFVGQ